MPSIKISALTAKTTPAGTEEFVINDSGVSKKITADNITENNFTDTLKSKLDGIEASATADQSNAEIKTAYEANADTNAYTDVEKTKLSGIEANATADQTASEIKTAYESNADTNEFSDAEQTKLSGIESSANNYSHPTGAGNEHLPSTVSQTEAGYLNGVTSAIQTQIDGKTNESYVDTSISNLVASAPATLDTLNELAAALGDDANFSTTITNLIATKLALAGGTMTGTLGVTTVDWGNWTVTESAGVLYFASLGVNKAKLDASGNFTCVGDVISNGTV